MDQLTNYFGANVNANLLKLLVWSLEILGEVLGTCLILIAMALLTSDGYQNDLTLTRVLGISIFVVIEFAVTGYLVTTLICRFALRRKRRRLYPSACALLYLLHSTIFFVALGNSPFTVQNWIIQLTGACVTFGCTWSGNRLVNFWIRLYDNPLQNPPNLP